MNWLNSTNAKEIGTLYLIFSVFSGMIGTAFSVLIRLELSSPGVQYLQGDHQLFNVIISAHAFIMIFYMVMPGLVGGFGKISWSLNTIKKIVFFINTLTLAENKTSEAYLRKLGYNIKKESVENVTLASAIDDLALRSKIGPYLAGLIESDGSIAVHNKDSNTKKYSPKIMVVFNIVDEPLAKKLASITNTGTIYKKQDAGHVLWQIQKLDDVIKIINIINGYMRTPKIEALHRAIDWLNNDSTAYAGNINKLNLDQSPIDSNAWLAGFTDGDGNFSINLIDRKKNGNITSKRVQTFFRIEVRQTYHRQVSAEQGGLSYFAILNKIACYLGVNLLSRTREKDDKVFFAFIVISHSATSHEKVINYFNKFPLFSSKYLAFKDWSYVVELSRLRAGKVLTAKEILEVKKIKDQFNSKRKLFDFSHLDNLI